MAKMLLLSVVLAWMLVPLRLARRRHPARGLRRTLGLLAVFNLAYTLAVSYLFLRLS